MTALVYLHISASWVTLLVYFAVAFICYNIAALKSVIICLGNDYRILLDVLIWLDTRKFSPLASGECTSCTAYYNNT
jgi:hypothetical protein